MGADLSNLGSQVLHQQNGRLPRPSLLFNLAQVTHMTRESFVQLCLNQNRTVGKRESRKASDHDM